MRYLRWNQKEISSEAARNFGAPAGALPVTLFLERGVLQVEAPRLLRAVVLNKDTLAFTF
jgi:hypothetical protein